MSTSVLLSDWAPFPIFSFLTAKQLLALERVCKVWLTLLRSQTAQITLWKRCLKTEGNYPLGDLPELLPNETYRDLVCLCIAWSRDWNASYGFRNPVVVGSSTRESLPGWTGRPFRCVGTLKSGMGSWDVDDGGKLTYMRCTRTPTVPLPQIAKNWSGHVLDRPSQDLTPPTTQSGDDQLPHFTIQDGPGSAWLIDPKATYPPIPIPNREAQISGHYIVSHSSFDTSYTHTFTIHKLVPTSSPPTTPPTYTLQPLYTLTATTLTFNNTHLAYLFESSPETFTLRTTRIADNMIITETPWRAPREAPRAFEGPFVMMRVGLAFVDYDQVIVFNVVTLRRMVLIWREVEADDDDNDDDGGSSIGSGDGDSDSDDDDDIAGVGKSFNGGDENAYQPACASRDGSFLILPWAEGNVHHVVDPFARNIWKVAQPRGRGVGDGNLVVVRRGSGRTGRVEMGGKMGVLWRGVPA
ncbi:hypothetical protein HDV00_009924 [Rhizophlyctis rosea]|nr:hypothetical protein HDV00_009924 [Rhizophlyctis rosea]